MSVKVETKGPAPGHYYQRELEADTRPAPEFLRQSSPDMSGPDEVPIEKYVSRDYHAREVEKLWRKTWQWACREEEIPEVGDTFVYEICNMSVVVVRVTPSTIKAFQNVCLHRGRRLCDYASRVTELRCPFHGFSWNLDGSFRAGPTPWDFPHLTPAPSACPRSRWRPGAASSSSTWTPTARR